MCVLHYLGVVLQYITSSQCSIRIIEEYLKLDSQLI